jgi:hypothetical protein
MNNQEFDNKALLAESAQAVIKHLVRSVLLLTTVGLAPQLASGQSIPPPPGLVAWWPGDGTLDDIAGTNDGIARGSLGYTTAGMVGQAFSLNGTDSYIEVPDSPRLNPRSGITVEAWYKPVSFAGVGNNPIVVKPFTSHNEPYYQYDLTVVGDQYDFPMSYAMFGFWIAIGPNARESVYTPSGAWTPGNWYHLVGTYDGASVKLYVNGALVGEKAAAGSLQDFGQPVYIGKQYPYPNEGPRCTPGTIDEVSIYNRALTATEVTAIHAAGSFGKSTFRILTQPQSQLSFWGKGVTFSVTADSPALPLTYVWSKDGKPVSEATEATLTLSNLQLTDAGTFTVVVTDAAGSSITSAPATLTVNPAGVGIALYAGVTIDGVVGQTYGIQATTNLSDTGSWIGVANVTLSVPTQLWYDSQSTTQHPKRFYRVVAGPISIP